VSLLDAHLGARRDEGIARLRRLLALRAMAAMGTSQNQVADALGVTQPVVSQHLKSARELDTGDPEVLLEAAGPVLTALAAERGYSRLAAFGSLARGQATRDSDVDFMTTSAVTRSCSDGAEGPEGTAAHPGLTRARRADVDRGKDSVSLT
jgi:hypothetical protein